MMRCSMGLLLCGKNLLHLVSSIPKNNGRNGARRSHPVIRVKNPRLKMSKTAAIRLSPPPTLFSRFLVAVDRWLMTYAEIQIRNGDVPRVGL